MYQFPHLFCQILAKNSVTKQTNRHQKFTTHDDRASQFNSIRLCANTHAHIRMWSCGQRCKSIILLSNRKTTFQIADGTDVHFHVSLKEIKKILRLWPEYRSCDTKCRSLYSHHIDCVYHAANKHNRCSITNLCEAKEGD